MLKMDTRDPWSDRQTLNENMTENELQPLNKINNDVEKTTVKEKEMGFWEKIRIYFREYCANSSLHGVRYFGEEGRTITERVWWLIIFIASLVICSNQIMKTWHKWDTSPLIVSHAQNPSPVWQVPFPAVTICPETKVRQTVYNFTKEYNRYKEAIINNNVSGEFTEDEIKHFQDVSLICDNHLLATGPKTTDNSVIDFIHEVAPEFDDTMWICKWTNKLNTTCRELFYPGLTEEGVCFTFNMLDSPELLNSEVQDDHYLNHGLKASWSLFEGYEKGLDRDVHPKRALGSGIKSGLTFVMKSNDYDLDYICKGPVQGFKILLHNPAESPRISQQYFRAPLNREVLVAVKPDMITTSVGLKDYHPSRRYCYFEGEKKLSFFKVYTQKNCEVECLANYILENCGCVPFYMPRSKETPICGSGNAHCMAKQQLNLLLREVETELSEENVEAENKKNMNKCNCLPSCTSLSYSAEISQSDFNWKEMLRAFQTDISEFSGVHMTRVSIFFKDTEFVASRRSELYGQTDFLSSCGGLLALFMGFSLLSLVEIIYFLTLRMWCNIVMYGRKMWNAPKNNSIQ